MTIRKHQVIIFTLWVYVLVFSACTSARSRIEQPQFSQWHYTYTVLLDPGNPQDSPQLDLAFSLLQMHFPAEQAAFVNEVLYSGDDLDRYANRVMVEQREIFRRALPHPADHDWENHVLPASSIGNWRYAQRFFVKSYEPSGLIIGREIETYTGGAHGLRTLRYDHVDLDALRLVRIDDLFQDFEGERTRALIYEELRSYSGLESYQPLSEGIFFSDEPELSFNFFITPDGLGFIWDPYAIAPYSQGIIEIVIPWRRVRPLLLHSGMELLTKFNIHLFI